LGHKVAEVDREKLGIHPHFPERGADMMRNVFVAAGLILASVSAASAQQPAARIDANGNLDALVSRHAAANNLPEDLVRRVIKRESGGNPRVISKGNYGVMQIRLGTARALGYRGTAAGLLDADTNMTYAVKYLAGAYKVADGNPTRAVHYYAAGYYYAAKSKGMSDGVAVQPAVVVARAPVEGPNGQVPTGHYSGPGSQSFE
jgi:soluble lytic murein transglycosylase-like protein